MRCQAARNPHLPVPFWSLILRTQVALVHPEADVHPLDLLDSLQLLHEHRGDSEAATSSPKAVTDSCTAAVISPAECVPVDGLRRRNIG
ncbi:hypothetical protein RKD22_000723 [Streptomyces pristinaespiralis]